MICVPLVLGGHCLPGAGPLQGKGLSYLLAPYRLSPLAQCPKSECPIFLWIDCDFSFVMSTFAKGGRRGRNRELRRSCGAARGSRASAGAGLLCGARCFVVAELAVALVCRSRPAAAGRGAAAAGGCNVASRVGSTLDAPKQPSI